MRATTWSLDEFAMSADFGAFTPPESATPERPAAEIEAEVQARLAAERSRAEAAAYSRGRADGERAVRAEADEQVSLTVQALSEAIELLQQNETRWVGHAEENIAALAVMVARHIVQRELTTDPSFVREIVERALAQYPVDQEITVRLNPTDLAACRAPIEANGPREIRWISDASIQRGGCLMEGRERILDGRIDTALERAYRNLGGIQA